MVVPDEDAQDGQGKEEEQGCAGSQHCAEGLVVGQEVSCFGDALTLLHIGPLVLRALLTHSTI